MSKEEKTTDKKAEVQVKETSGGKVYNFTRQGFIVEAKSLKEAQKALENHLKEQAKEEAK